jgi:hypothetical protein
MASQRSLRPNVKKSYKNTCGAEAPQTSLLQRRSTTISTKGKGKKAAKPTNTETLLYTQSGNRLPLGAVSIVISSFIYLTINGPVVWKLP